MTQTAELKNTMGIELLNFTYQNSQMGVATIEHLLEIVEDEDFKKHLIGQMREYHKINSRAEKMLAEKGYDEKGLTRLEKLRTYLMINLQTLNDKSVSHISEMLITGSTMGVIDAVKNLKKYNDAEREITGLMGDLLQIEEGNIQQLKRFL